MPDRDPDVRLAITHSIKVLSMWTVALYLIVGIVLGAAVYNNRIQAARANTDAQRIDTALCVFVEDLQHRVDGTVDFLKENPGREPIPGVSRATFRANLVNQRRTLNSLDGLRCNESP